MSRTHTKTKKRSLPIILAVLAAGVILAVALVIFGGKPEPDPHAGQVCIFDGVSARWITPLEGVDASTLKPEDFVRMNERPIYVGTQYDTMLGIDVSEHQHQIRWNETASDGIQFAYIRAAFRGYTQGKLYEDPYFRYNMKNALDNGLPVGVYVFSQALTVEEAVEEADYVLELVGDYTLSLPIMFDWEPMEFSDSRTQTHDTQTLNDCALAFCARIEAAGYDAGVYYNKYYGYNEFDLSRLKDYTLWLAQPADAPDFYYAFDIWQSSFTGSVKGIDTEVDLDILFIPKENEENETELVS